MTKATRAVRAWLAAAVILAPVAGAASAETLKAVVVTPSPTLCAEGRLALDIDGKPGYLVPAVGPSVIRGSLDIATPVTWQVVALDRVDGATRDRLAPAYALCTKAR